MTNTGHLIVDPGKGGTVAKNYNGLLTNTGKLEVRSGTFRLAAGFAQSRAVSTSRRRRCSTTPRKARSR